jgi:hypothetical protein
MVTRQGLTEVDEARAIVQAFRELQGDPRLRDRARTDITAVLDDMKLSGTVRHAVAATLAMSLSGVLLIPGSPVFWSV